MSSSVNPNLYIIRLCTEFRISDKLGIPRLPLDQHVAETAQRNDFWISLPKSDPFLPHVSVWTVPKNALGKFLKRIFRGKTPNLLLISR